MTLSSSRCSADTPFTRTPNSAFSLVRRDRPVLPRGAGTKQNGIYVATTAENALKVTQIFKGADFQHLKDGKVWIFISESSGNFEAYSIEACELIADRDLRIGR